MKLLKDKVDDATMAEQLEELWEDDVVRARVFAVVRVVAVKWVHDRNVPTLLSKRSWCTLT
jgi:hypothetical protein